MIGLIAPLLVRIGIPERLHRAVIWVALAALCAVLVAWWFARHDAKVIERHEVKREASASDARELSAEERAADAMEGLIVEQARERDIAKAAASEAAKPPEQRAALPPTSVALNCNRLLRSYSAAELAKMPAYQEKCR